jgi:hypothetical protein
MEWLRGYTVSWRLPWCAMLMNTGPKLYCWPCWESAVHGRRTWKPHQWNWCTVTGGILHPLPCQVHQHHWLCFPAESPHRKASACTSLLRHPRSFSKTWPLPPMSFYDKAPSKPRMLAHTGSSTGVRRPIPSKFMVLRWQSPFTTWSRHMSYMLTSNLLHHRPFLPGPSAGGGGWWWWCGGCHWLGHPRSFQPPQNV